MTTMNVLRMFHHESTTTLLSRQMNTKTARFEEVLLETCRISLFMSNLPLERSVKRRRGCVAVYPHLELWVHLDLCVHQRGCQDRCQSLWVYQGPKARLDHRQSRRNRQSHRRGLSLQEPRRYCCRVASFVRQSQSLNQSLSQTC